MPRSGHIAPLGYSPIGFGLDLLRLRRPSSLLQFQDMKLFQDVNGDPIVFYFRPCKKRSQIQPIIEANGGKVTVRFDKSFIKLADDTDAVSTDDYISARYIEDCVKENTLLSLDSYRLKRKSRTSTGDEDNVSDISVEDVGEYHTVNMRSIKGRQKYTQTEDMEILAYIMKEKRYKEMTGNRLWKDMVYLEITKHSYQSMKCRFNKVILHNLDDYDIPAGWKKTLRAKFPELIDSPAKRTERKGGSAKGSVTGDSDIEDEIDKLLMDHVNLKKKKTNNAKTDKEKITHPDNSVDVDIVDRRPREIASNNSVAQNGKVAHSNKAVTSNGIVTRSNKKAQGNKSVPEENTIENGPSVCDNFLPSNPDISSSQDEERDTTTENANSNNSQLENGSSDDEEVSQIIESLCADFNISAREAYHLLWLNDGDVQETVSFLKGKRLKSGGPIWKIKHDRFLRRSSADDDDSGMETDERMDDLIKIYGKKRVRERIAFLEGI